MKSSTLVEVIPGIGVLPRTWGCNVYLRERAPGALIDSGFPLDTRRVERALVDSRRMPSVFFATHCHLDHMGSLAELKSTYGTPVAAHRADAPVMEGTEPYRMFKLDPLRTLYYKALAPLYPYRYVEVDLLLDDGDLVDGLEVIHVPGHTAGSIALYDRDCGALFSGDCIRNEKGVIQGPPPQFTPDMDLAMRCISEKLLPLEFDVLLPGHGDPVVGGAWRAVEKMMRDAG